VPPMARRAAAGSGRVAGVHRIRCFGPRFFTGFGLGARGDDGELDGGLGTVVRWPERCAPLWHAARWLRRAIAVAGR
jgi:hypothetical protein